MSSLAPRDPPPPGAAALTEGFYRELHDLAVRAFAAEKSGHTLQPTAVVHEACVRMLSSSPLPDVPRSERLAPGRARHAPGAGRPPPRRAARRSAAAGRCASSSTPSWRTGAGATADFAAVHAALERLRALHARQAEVVTLKVFGGLTMEEVARSLAVSKRTVEDDWAVARAWLRRALAGAWA